jgi:hypothetical protein
MPATKFHWEEKKKNPGVWPANEPDPGGVNTSSP